MPINHLLLIFAKYNFKYFKQHNYSVVISHIVCLTMRHHLFLEFWLVNTCWLTSSPCCNSLRKCTPCKKLLFNCHKNTLSGATQKQPPGSVVKKRCSENMQQIYRFEQPCWTVISIKLLCNFATPFPKNTSGGLLLAIEFLSTRRTYSF